MWLFKCFSTINGHLEQHFLCQRERFTVLPSVGVSMRAPYIWPLHNELLFAGALAEIHTELTSGWSWRAEDTRSVHLPSSPQTRQTSQKRANHLPHLRVCSLCCGITGTTPPPTLNRKNNPDWSAAKGFWRGTNGWNVPPLKFPKDFGVFLFARGKNGWWRVESPRELMDPVGVMEYARRRLKCPHLIDNSLAQQSRHAASASFAVHRNSPAHPWDSLNHFPATGHCVEACKITSDPIHSAHCAFQLVASRRRYTSTALKNHLLRKQFDANCCSHSDSEPSAGWSLASVQCLSKCVSLGCISRFVFQCGAMIMIIHSSSLAVGVYEESIDCQSINYSINQY